MSTIGQLLVLAFASTVVAGPAYGKAHGHGHQHLHSREVPYPYPHVNATGTWGSTGLGTAPAYSPSAPAYSSPASSYSRGGSTWTSTIVQTVFQTVSRASTSSNAAASPAASAPGSGAACGQDVTVTSTEKVYITVTAGYPSASSYSSQSAPVASSSSSAASPPASSAPAYSGPSAVPVSSSKEASPGSHSSSAAAPSYSSPVVSSSAVPSSSAATASTTQTSSSTSSAPASYSSGVSTSGGKRGLAYNSASLITCFDNSPEITWAYNWVSASAGLTGNLKFIPTLHDGSEYFTSRWNTEASASIASGSTTLFSFNEPDQDTQANMTPQDAADMYIEYMNPYAGKAQLCAPSVTNSQSSSMGLNWLQQFLAACDGKCHIDCYNIHWYNTPDADDFKNQVTSAIELATDKTTGKTKPVWVTEFACNGASDDQVTSFLEEVMPWMDSNDDIAGYAYFMASDGSLITGTEPSTYGEVYSSYTG